MSLVKVAVVLTIILVGVIGFLVYFRGDEVLPLISPLSHTESSTEQGKDSESAGHPLAIATMRAANYLGSELKIERTLTDGSNYRQYVASYVSEGSMIYGLLTVPKGEKPSEGWPVIIFNHGYIPPEQYRTTERYVAYVAALARSGYIVFKPDYRGHGDSQGQPSGAYYSPGYTIDVLNAVATLKQYPDADPERIGMWGHSMGGSITLRSMVTTKDVKVGVIWGGVVGTYDDLINRWRRRATWRPSNREQSSVRPGRQQLIAAYGDPVQNPTFWHSIDPVYFVGDVSGPIQLHHATNDGTVPWEFSQVLSQALQGAGKIGEFYQYSGGDHDIESPYFETAMQRTIAFFDQYLK